ncbi:hypothetical protein GCM10010349_24590 [Streptomyces flavofungini]|nr:hypothetical protein GCM10010349_24590 [Streptomyces flavofungini]
MVLSYRQVVRAYPIGGGSYGVAATNLGPSAGLVVAATLLVDYMNLRGVRESGRALAAPTYLSVGGVVIMIGTGLFRYLLGDAPVAESAGYGIAPEGGDAQLTDWPW